jgi:hypothetical protein
MGKATIRRRLTSKRKLNRKNKKTQRKGKKQSGGRRRPDGPGTAGAAYANNGVMNEGGPDYLNEEEKGRAIELITANKLEELRPLLEGRSFQDHDALMAAVTMRGANEEMISEVMVRTPIGPSTESNISTAIHTDSDLQTMFLEILNAEEERREEARRLQEQEQKYANNDRVSTPLPRTMNEEY